MGYQRHKVFAGDGLYVSEYYTHRLHPAGETRQRRNRPSSESVRASNDRMAANRMKWKLNENFTKGDYFVTLTYGKGKNKTVTWEQMQRDLRDFLRRLKYRYGKQGIELRYVSAAEVGRKGAKHFHLVIGAGDPAAVAEAWREGFARVKIVGDPGDGRNTYDSIAEYMSKQSRKTRELLGADKAKRYTCSRNLRAPKEEKQDLLRGRIDRDKPYCQPGYYIVQDTVTDYVNEYGYAVREYLALREEPKHERTEKRDRAAVARPGAIRHGGHQGAAGGIRARRR